MFPRGIVSWVDDNEGWAFETFQPTSTPVHELIRFFERLVVAINSVVASLSPTSFNNYPPKENFLPIFRDNFYSPLNFSSIMRNSPSFDSLEKIESLEIIVNTDIIEIS